MQWDAEAQQWVARNPGNGWGDTPRPDITHREPDGSGWDARNRGDHKPWMDYQQQISGIDPTPDGRIPEYAQVDPDTGKIVDFDGHTYRGDPPVETFLEAKDGYARLHHDPTSDWSKTKTEELVIQAERQRDALPDDAMLEWHVSDPYGAAAIQRALEDAGIVDVTVIYTPKA